MNRTLRYTGVRGEEISRYRLGFAMLIAVCISACGGGGDGGSSNPPPAPATHTIGGNISGLQGTVVLQNNGTDQVSASNAGAFSFPTTLASGAAYSVTVATQPSGQTCVVTNGSGSVLGANVTNVTVTCDTNQQVSYTVGGSVTGLNGALVLQNNGIDDLTVSSNGTFVFATPIPSGQAYAVSILTQPTGQTCAIANATGTVTNANVTASVTCTDSAGGALMWHTPVALGGGSSPYAPGAPRVAINGQGTAIAVWRQYDGSSYSVRFVMFADNTWTTEQTLTTTTSSIDSPNVAIDEDGNALAVWYQSGSIYGAYYTGSSWSTPQAISIPGAVMPAANGLGFTPAGTAIVISFVSGDGVYAIRRPRSSGWQLPERLGTGRGVGAGLQLVFHGSDSASAVWSGEAQYQLTKRTYSGGAWDVAVSSNVFSGLDTFSFLSGNGAAADSSGNLQVLGERWTNGVRNVASLRYVTATGWATSLTNVIAIPVLGFDDFKIAANANGNAVAFFESTGVQAAYFNPVSGWTTATTLSGGGIYPRLGINSTGDAFVTWQSTGSGGGSVLASRYDFSSGVWSLGASIDGGTGYNSDHDTAVSANGTAVVIWKKSINGGNFVYGNYFR